VAVGVFFAGYFVGVYTDKDVATLKFVLENYKRYYLNEDENYLDVMIDSLLEGDKYSEYYSKEEYDVIKKSAEGKQAGVGISINATTFEIVRVVSNSPAEKVGVKAGGKITAYKKSSQSEYINVVEKDKFDKFMASVGVGEEICLKVLYQTEEEFKIKKQEYVNKTFRISKDLSDRLAIAAQKEGVSMNEFVVQSCEYALANLKSTEEPDG
jgi:C-terminal processing protease CtpA/Prc